MYRRARQKTSEQLWWFTAYFCRKLARRKRHASNRSRHFLLVPHLFVWWNEVVLGFRTSWLDFESAVAQFGLGSSVVKSCVGPI
jgi:hypothetical protein